jgi:hypothetical protein
MKRFFKHFLLVAAIGCFLMYPVLIILGSFYPAALSFMEPVMCPPGMHLGSKIVRQSTGRGNEISTHSVCRGDDGEVVYVTGRLLLITLAFVVSGVLLLVARSRIRTMETSNDKSGFIIVTIRD